MTPEDTFILQPLRGLLGAIAILETMRPSAVTLLLQGSPPGSPLIRQASKAWGPWEQLRGSRQEAKHCRALEDQASRDRGAGQG